MIPIAAGSLALYYGVAGFIISKDYRPRGNVDIPFTDTPVSASNLALIPPMLFLAAAIIFALGYLPIKRSMTLDKIRGTDEDNQDSVESVRTAIIRQRAWAGYLGMAAFALGVVMTGLVVQRLAAAEGQMVATETLQSAIVVGTNGSVTCGELISGVEPGAVSLSVPRGDSVVVADVAELHLVEHCPGPAIHTG